MNSSKIQFYNTLSRKKEIFAPINPPDVSFYSCGPTVYDYAHIGNLRAYVFADILQKTLEYSGYKVRRVMNITDIGHLSSDADSGEDKMTKGLLREGKEFTLKNMREMAEFYTEKFKEDLQALNIEIPENIYYASDYVKEDIELVQKLEEKGYTYKISDGIYFNTSKMPDYGILWGVAKNREESRSRIIENSEKINSEDFALWKFNSKIGFESPWGKGFPGWHIECSAMGMKFLGEQFDIHTGGIDLIPTHHTNEIAQSECATGKKPFVRFWMHSEFVDTGGVKMSKSENNFLRLESLAVKNISPATYRFWLLMANYRTKVNFVWEALEGAETALKRLYGLYLDLENETPPRTGQVGHIHQEYQNKFKEFLEDDLDTPRALSLLWDVFKDENISNADKKATILDFDKIFGLGFADLKEEIIPEEILKLGEKIEEARKNKNFKESDRIREKIEKKWEYEVKNTATGTTFTKKKI
ncbi:MAG: Cysteine-tRNA ligase [Candidatus Nomurabacteria bacterium GW2011_GWC2_41_8]|uniref:Cysteine--tRNA ligase n=3 Tax=Candidatus Nomuraibacteriota TaxID=1752729 RepID=A0A1F6YAK2_9BACT|nr:MAG: Cysteine-tRNA ligase [Candidatus Nomurabacteria bacterium GW2011_GWA2_41_25]KKS23657.1 MAG: Cysteine-tRNA ligase [Candidatus Nomurabacteria bacterium GW2011_GWC2_41_8]OGI66817.1 MAG: cysteine--tRNA ligase [Candidatus Nomurabacteria bacterium RIFCSPHIGHO2_01_FULL_41_91]OGI80226.1 MAG: cysteine--tRNA ligase [Candidatus Nomurabacteria bacterium RIFCSPHIGHO2_02_FULL_41_52]OGI84724.1 MAG: cysteine--tRNA ligase [Candidatus Nomurabacteria bacterium RIFCSPHIGHO2_12_FULL_42_19]OGI93561.1 MAG: c